uniref:Glycine N-acyltransferase-like protein n=1 Tax=Caenorhabditis japonica TaxID=281687 RepID=A0A8R1HRF2_CAEJA
MKATLIEITTRENLIRAQAQCSRDISAIYFPFSIHTQLEESFPESPVRVFVYPNLSHPKMFFMFKNNEFIKATLALAQVSGTSMNRIELVELIQEFRTRVFGAQRQPHLVIAEEHLIKMYSVAMRLSSSNWNNNDLRLSLFYMTEKQKKFALTSSLPNVPQGYYYDDIDPIEEAEIVNSTWKHAGAGDLEQTMAKLIRLPSSCVRYNGKPVAFEMIDPAGFFNNQYVFEDHRRKGLGNAVEMDLIHKCLQTGISPFKTVAKDNKIVLDASIASKFWTMWTDEEGNAKTVVFQTWNCE